MKLIINNNITAVKYSAKIKKTKHGYIFYSKLEAKGLDSPIESFSAAFSNKEKAKAYMLKNLGKEFITSVFMTTEG